MTSSVTATSNLFSSLTLDPHTNILCPNQQPPTQAAAVLRGLVEEADRIGNSLAIASVLAGLSSEGDDYADVALWLGKGDYHRVENVLEVLGLQYAQPTTNIPLSPESHLPVTLPLSNAQAALISDHLDKFSGIYCVSAPLQPSRTVYILLGQLDDGWGGLIGVGIHSDD